MKNWSEFECLIMDMFVYENLSTEKQCQDFSDEIHKHVEMGVEDYYHKKDIKHTSVYSSSSLFRGTITKLPRDMDPNLLIKNEMKNKYSKCPFCGNEKWIDSFMFHINGGDEVARMGHEERYGRQHKRRFWEEKHHWRIDHWHCYKCGASWDSEEYPTDIQPEGIGE